MRTPQRDAGGGLLFAGRSLESLAAEHGTPLYAYDGPAIRAAYRRLREAFSPAPTLAYSVKANRHPGVLRLLADEGASFDVVSGPELELVLGLGIAAERIVFAGVGKSARELRLAVRAGIAQFNVESAGEARRLSRIAAEEQRRARVALRVIPNIDARTHPHITTGTDETKFGITPEEAGALLRELRGVASIEVVGLHAHIGSQITAPDVFAAAAERMEEVVRQLAAEAPAPFRTLNLGGGFGIDYRRDGTVPAPEVLARPLVEAASRLGLPLILEPGRCIVGPHGVLLTRVEYVKQTRSRCFVIVDAAMTDLLRPALYGAWHEVLPVRARATAPLTVVDVVGPVCESSDHLARGRALPLPDEGDLLAVLDAGAYGASMAGTYNARPPAKEVLLD